MIYKIQPLHGHLVQQVANVPIYLENKNPAINLYSYNCVTRAKAVEAQCLLCKKNEKKTTIIRIYSKWNAQQKNIWGTICEVDKIREKYYF